MAEQPKASKRERMRTVLADMFYECCLEPEDAFARADEALVKLEAIEREEHPLIVADAEEMIRRSGIAACPACLTNHIAHELETLGHNTTMLASNMDEFQRMIDTESTDGVWAAQGDDK
jgi:hypothetical protein